MQYITILGATGSIGVNTLNVIKEHLDKVEVFALTGFSQIEKLANLCINFKPTYVVVKDKSKEEDLKKIFQENNYKGTLILFGEESLNFVASHRKVTTVMSSIVGIAGLKPTLAALKSSKKVLLANKESLVSAGHIFMKVAKEYNANLIPVDSEHNAIFQCLPDYSKVYNNKEIDKIILTASGGQFIDKDFKDLTNITIEDACNHPTWKMGQKISVDSSTLMNKSLEIVEAYFLFQVPIEKLEVLIHRQSIIHSLVKYQDGSFLAQMGSPDMKTPIANALFYPERQKINNIELDLTLKTLTFEQINLERFPFIKMISDFLRNKQYSAIIAMNAVNEVCVSYFLQDKIKYLDIFTIVKEITVKFINLKPAKNIDDVIKIDKQARDFVDMYLEGKK